MNTALSASLLLHASLFFGVALWQAEIERFETSAAVLPIELMTLDEFNALYEPEKRPETAQTAIAVASLAPPSADADAMPTLDATPAPKTPEQAKPESSVLALSNPRPRSRPDFSAKKKPILDIQHVHALLNKLPDAPEGVATPDPTPAPEPQESLGNRVSSSEIAALRAQIQACWTLPAGARDAGAMNVVVRMHLTPDGQISAGPMVVNRARLRDPVFRTAAESVLRAVNRCQPYKMPIDKHANWRVMELNFDPKTVLGG